MAQRLCGRRVAASAPVQEPAPRPGEDLPRPQAARQPPPRSRGPRSQLRHAPPGSAVAAGPPAAGLRAAWLPAPSALCRRPRRVSGNPATAGRERGAKADSGLGGALASEKWAFGFLPDLCFLFHAQLYKVIQNQRVPSAKSLQLQTPSPGTYSSAFCICPERIYVSANTGVYLFCCGSLTHCFLQYALEKLMQINVKPLSSGFN